MPPFYERDADGLPAAWLRMMRSSIARVGGMFTSHRMVQDYVERSYLPAHRAGAAGRRRAALTSAGARLG